MQSAIYLVDASSYIFRAYYAMRPGLKAPDGTPTHATYGFIQMSLGLLDKFQPHSIIYVWDHKDKNFRHGLDESYKANRSAPPDDLGVQIDNSKKFLDLYGVPQVEKSGFEADDLIATIIHKNSDTNFIIVTGDKDLLQLVGDRVWCLDTMKDKWSNNAEAEEKFGVEPARISQVQALCGDSVDNIPGAPGIGPKTAAELMQYYGNLEAILLQAKKKYDNAGAAGTDQKTDKSEPLKGKRIAAIAENIELIRKCLQLVSLHTDVPIEFATSLYERRKMNPESLREFCLDLGLSKFLERIKSDNPEMPARKAVEYDWKPICLDSAEEVKRVFDENRNAACMALDTETTGLDYLSRDHLVGLSFCFSDSVGYYVPLAHKTGTNAKCEDVLALLQDFLDGGSPRQSLVLQNAKFDEHVLLSAGLKWPSNISVEDTMLASFAIDPAEAHGMDALALKYLNGYVTKAFKEVLGEAENFSEVSIEAASFYSAEDAVITFRLWHLLRAELEKLGLWTVYHELDRPLIGVLRDMERLGIAVNPTVLKKYSLQWHEELELQQKQSLQMLRDCGVEIAEDFNLGSPKQIATILYEKLGLPILKKGKTSPSTDMSVLTELSELHPFPMALVEIRELAKLVSTYVDTLPALIRPETGRVHTEFSQVIAVTGRLASSKPNLQNIPIRTDRGRKIREAFIAAEGFELVGIDYSQMELRLLAFMSGDKALNKAFLEGADIHRRTASIMLEKPEDQIGDEERRMAKTINFGIIYGQSAFGLAKQLKISRTEAQKFIDAYFKSYPGIKTYTEKALAEARESSMAVTLTGRRRFLPDIHSKTMPLRQFSERIAVNSPIQGTASDWMKAAMIEVHRVLAQRHPDSRLILQVHDELILEVPLGKAESVMADLKLSMESDLLKKSFNISLLPLVMKVDSAHGLSWGDL